MIKFTAPTGGKFSFSFPILVFWLNQREQQPFRTNYLIMIILTFSNEQNYLSNGIKLVLLDFRKKDNKRPRGLFRAIKSQLNCFPCFIAASGLKYIINSVSPIKQINRSFSYFIIPYIQFRLVFWFVPFYFKTICPFI